jgi:hypothetical protein
MGRQVPGRLQAEPAFLDEPHEILAGDEAHAAREQRCDRERLGLEHAARGLGALVERVEHHAAGPALGERVLLVVDEAALHREGHQHAEHRQHDVEAEDLPPRQQGVGRPHVGREPRRERHRHVARRGRDRLHRVVLEDGHVAGPELRAHAVDRKCEDDRRQADTERPARLGADVQIGRAQDSAQQDDGK